VRAKKSVTAHTESITTDKVVVNTPTNRADHIATNTVATPVPPVATPPKTTVALATNAVPSAPENDRFFKDTWKNPSFVIGTRALVVSLQDTTRGTPGNGSYFGTITEITENQDTSPDKLYIQARIYRTPIWVGVSYDHISARTMDDGDGDGIPDTSGGDGDEELEGFIPYLQAAWNNQTRFTPYGQIGYAFYQAEFVPNSWGDNGRRYVEASSSASGLELGAGLSVRLYRNLSADVFVKSQKVSDITGDWYYNYGNNYGGPFIMTMSYVAYGAGLSCRF
jgi:hypothetical protein